MITIRSTSGSMRSISGSRMEPRILHANKCTLIIFPFLILILMYHGLSHGSFPSEPIHLIRVNNLSCSDAFKAYCKLVTTPNHELDTNVEDRELRNDLISQQTIDSHETFIKTNDQSTKRNEQTDDDLVANSDTKTIDTKTIDTNTIDTNTIDTKTIDTNTIDTDTIGTDTIDTDTIGTDTIDTDTIGTDTIDTNTVSTDYTHWCRQRLVGCKCPEGKSFDRIIGDCLTLVPPLSSCTRNQECQLYDPLTFCDYNPVSRHESPFCNCVPSAVLNVTSNKCTCKSDVPSNSYGYSFLGSSDPQPCYKYHSRPGSTTLAYSARTNQLLLPIKILMVIVTSILILVVIFCLGSTFYQKIKESIIQSSVPCPTPAMNQRSGYQTPNGIRSPDEFSSGSMSPDGDHGGFNVHVTNNNVHLLLPEGVTGGRRSPSTRGQYVQTDHDPSHDQVSYQHSFRDDPPPSYEEAMKHVKIIIRTNPTESHATEFSPSRVTQTSGESVPITISPDPGQAEEHHHHPTVINSPSNTNRDKYSDV